MGNSLYSISEREHNLLVLLQSGEVEEEVLAGALAEVEQELTTKAADYISVISAMQNHMVAVKAEIDRLTAYKKSLESNEKRLNQALLNAMVKLNKQSISTERGAIKVKLNPESTIIDDAALIPTEFTKTKIEVTPDKTAIKKAIQAGQDVPGCHLERSQRVVIK